MKPRMDRIQCVGLIALILLLAACTPSPAKTTPTTAIPPTPTLASRRPLSTDEVKRLASEVERLSGANLKAWADLDFDLMRQIYSEDVVHHDGNQELIKNLEDMIQFSKMWRTYIFPKYETRLGNTFIGKKDGFYIEESWGWEPDCSTGFTYTSDNPIINYMWLTLDEEKIAYWWVFYAESTCSKSISFDSKLLQEYADAWSSGDPETVAGLYTADAVREDNLFEENQQGNPAIYKVASGFFGWYPGVHLTLLNSFGELPREIKRGGIYSIHVSDLSGKPCEVKMLVVLEPDAALEKIAHEWVFYNADSLVSCGWAK